MSRSKRIRDLVIEILVAVVLVTGLVVYRFRHPYAEINWTGVAFIGNTVIVFGYLIAWFRNALKDTSFWACLLVLLLGHVAVYVFILSRIGQVPLIHFVILNAGELAVLPPLLRRVISKGPFGKL